MTDSLRERNGDTAGWLALVLCSVACSGCASPIWTETAFRDVDGVFAVLRGVDADAVTIQSSRLRGPWARVEAGPELASMFAGTVELIAESGERLFFDFSDSARDLAEGRVYVTVIAPPRQGGWMVSSCFAAPRVSFAVSGGIQIEAPSGCRLDYQLRTDRIGGPTALEIHLSLVADDLGALNESSRIRSSAEELAGAASSASPE